MSPQLKNLRSLAIVLPSWVGDTIMATPVLRALRQALPEARLVGVMRRGLDEVLAGTTWLDEMIVCDMKGALGAWRLARALRSTRAEAVLLLPNSFRSALAARISGIPRRIGYARDRRGWLLTDRKEVSHTFVPMVRYYAELAQWTLGVDAIDEHFELATTEQERRAADELLREVRAPFVLLNPGANRSDKRWPATNFAKLADRLGAAHDVRIVISGSPKEKDMLEEVARSAQTPMVNLAERGVRLGSLKAVIQRAALVITNDTGPRHIAAALGTPVVTLFGPTDHRWTTLNYERERLLVAEPFLPEELIADQHPKACAIEKISVNDVIAAAEALLRPREAASSAG